MTWIKAEKWRLRQNLPLLVRNVPLWHQFKAISLEGSTTLDSEAAPPAAICTGQIRHP